MALPLQGRSHSRLPISSIPLIVLQGIVYFISHRALWQPFLSKLPQYIALYGSVVVGMFTFTYLPQLGVLVFVNGPLAVFTTGLLVLNESATIVGMVARTWLLQEALLNTFDGTLLARNKGELVQEGRELKSGNDPISRLGRAIKSPFSRFSPKAIVRYFMYLPLNFIPVVGTVVFLFIQARGRGRGVHDRVSQTSFDIVGTTFSNSFCSTFNSRNGPRLRGRTGFRDILAHTLREYSVPYQWLLANLYRCSFGLVATVLEMIPLASVFFTYTNAGQYMQSTEPETCFQQCAN